MWNRELARKRAEEGRAKYNASVKYRDRDIYKGLTFWSPNVNIFRDPRWGRGHETYGEDPYLTSRLGVAFVTGLQGDGDYMKAAACAKHFAVHSGPEVLRHSFDAKATKKDMYETYLPAFEACVKEAHVEAVMGAYNRTNGEPCCANEVMMNQILRGEWGFEGHYVSDCWAIRDFHENHRVTNNGVESSAMALNAGCDVNCGCTYLCLKEAYRKKLIKKSQIRQAAVRLFTTRFLLGLFDETEYDTISYLCVESKKHLKLSEEPDSQKKVRLNVKVKNESDRKVKDVVEVYVKNHDSEYAPLNPALCGFKKFEVNAGEEKTIEVVVSERAFMVVNENGEFIKDGSSSTLYVATSGVDERSTELTEVSPKEINMKW